MVKTVIANLSTKLCEISHNIHRNLTANNSIKTAEIQTNVVKNNNNKMIVRGNIAACKAPKRTNNINAHANDEL